MRFKAVGFGALYRPSNSENVRREYQVNSDLLREIEANIELLMAESIEDDRDREGGYWYPLSRPTYGSAEVIAALDSMCKFRTSMWEKTRLFEEAFGAKYGGEAIMVNSGSSADLLIAFGLHRLSGGPLDYGDEILVPAVTWPTQLWSLLMAGYSARLVDVDPVTLNVDFEDLELKVTSKTRAISLVHLMGNPVDMDRIQSICQQHNLILIEDCCESLGAKWRGQYVGTFGQASSFSFFFSHHLTTMEGGMILTRDPVLAERFRLLRAHGWSRNLKNPPAPATGLDSRYTFLNWGFNVRPTELQAGFGLVQLEKSEEFQQFRDGNAEIAIRRLSLHTDFLRLMHTGAEGTCTWFALPIMVLKGAPFTRKEITEFLEANGVETRPIVTGNLARHPAAKNFPEVLSTGALSGADEIHEHGFYVGLHPIDNSRELMRLFDLIDEFVFESAA